MTYDEAIAQLETAGAMTSEALAVIEAGNDSPDLAFLHGLAARLGHRLEDILGQPHGKFVKNFDGTPKPS